MKYAFCKIPLLCMIGFLSCSNEDHDSTRLTDWPEDPGITSNTSGVDRLYNLGDELSDEGIRLVWRDEFDTGYMPNEEYWSYEEGLVRNNEIQYYTVRRDINCRVEDGELILTGLKDNYTAADGTTHAYTSASIITNKKISWQYGRFEIRAKVPSGSSGIWPAFWAKGDSQNTDDAWPMCGEIDIMEYAVRDPYNMIQNIYWGDSSTAAKKKEKKVNSSVKYSEDYHVYSLNWNESQLVFAIDNLVTHVINMSEVDGEKNPFHQPFSILLNLALGTADGSGLGGKVDDKSLPAVFRVDYVRIYQTPE